MIHKNIDYICAKLSKIHFNSKKNVLKTEYICSENELRLTYCKDFKIHCMLLQTEIDPM